ncbi:helix-turn-helix domain-containing protein [Neobacillus sp. PS3-40]|uniref:helix-turn-helix domain-containing protein n=1 Tax=Neobacillus sp. PS3-40 TaxID=3070679 RepID=UPI0027E08CDA|nr:helix-turn-helix domain-containing protein [Neobacillus sp. PS3-40]WML45150.1 helix-turn-helix domain-containing protein [Neobacillus sp. PS3-40]
MRYIEYIILFCLKKLNGERTIYSIYHLLKGKKSSQTIQDAHLFGLIRFFRIYEPLTRETLEEVIQNALEHKWISPCEGQRFLLTNLGEEKINLFRENHTDPIYINGWQFNSVAQQFWERLTMLIQVVSNLVFQETHYIPIQKNKTVHIWLKSFLKNNQLDRILLGKTIFSELLDCLEDTNEFDPSVIIFRLTGYKRIGLTSLQTAEKLGMEFSSYHIAFQNVLHYLIQQVKTDINRYPVLSFLLVDIKENSLLTNSSQITFDLVQKGCSIEEIAKRRHLKTSTIEDHIVEIALKIEEFSIDPFIDYGIQKKIISVARKSATKQLKLIRSSVDSANYFEIRLVLAKYGAKQWN